MSSMPTTFDKDAPRFAGNPQDFYVTDPRLVQACLAIIQRLRPVVTRFLDPGCGSGNWGKEARKRWPMTWSAGVDLVERMVPEEKRMIYDEFILGDFITTEFNPYRDYDLIAGNPPFSSKEDKTLARKFIAKGLSLLTDDGLLGYVLKTEAVCSVDRYEHIFMNNPPIEQWVCVQRPGWYGDGTTNTIEYSFFIWAKANPAGYTKTRWMNWRG